MENTLNKEEVATGKLEQYLTRNQWLFYAFIIAVGIGLRWFELETRPFHHDESQHAMFGKYFFDFPEIQFYKYDPMMHAPLLYNFFRAVYTALGNTLWASRAPIALIGTLFLFVPLLFRKYFTPTALLALTAAISFSSSMVYWSRFVIHDYFVVLSMLIALYGVLLARPERKAFYVILGFTLQFCIKANIFVTVAIVLGYCIFQAGFKYFVTDYNSESIIKLKDYFLKYSPHFGLSYIGLTLLAHYIILERIALDSDLWGALSRFAQYKPIIFFLASFILFATAFLISFWTSEGSDNYFRRSWLNVKTHWRPFVLSMIVGILVFCYIFSSGFRNADGILDGLYYRSIPYWLNQHNMERIKGPLLFNFYIFSWYEFAFLVFFLIHLFLFYKRAGQIARYAALTALCLGVLLGFSMLVYTSPSEINGPWRSVEEIGSRDVASLSRWIDVLATHFVHFFKVKDALDVTGLVLLLIHPVIVTSTHLKRRESTLAFWGYLFTASFFSYSFLGEKVPWLSIYPMIPGFIYLTLYFDDYFKWYPVNDYATYPWSRIFQIVSLVLLPLGIFFIGENIISITTLFEPGSFVKIIDGFKEGGVFRMITTVKNGVDENLLIFLFGFILYTLHYFNRWSNLLGTVNLKVLLFAVVSIFCVRGAILTNFVYAGSETELISQVHTTREFHMLALRLRQEALANIRPQPFTVLADGDPVWPLTWYMVGVNDFKFSATPEERKEFDVIIETWVEEPKDVPEGFTKRRINLRGWWVPDFNTMSLRKFLNVAVNHFPWSPSGFSYVWVFVNPKKG